MIGPVLVLKMNHIQGLTEIMFERAATRAKELDEILATTGKVM